MNNSLAEVRLELIVVNYSLGYNLGLQVTKSYKERKNN